MAYIMRFLKQVLVNDTNELVWFLGLLIAIILVITSSALFHFIIEKPLIDYSKKLIMIHTRN